MGRAPGGNQGFMSAPKIETRELPEHERLALVKDKSHEIGTFLEWLTEQGIGLSKYHKHSEECGKVYSNGYSKECKMTEDTLSPYPMNIEVLLARFYGIDLDKLEREKRQILADIRKRAAGKAIDKKLGL